MLILYTISAYKQSRGGKSFHLADYSVVSIICLLAPRLSLTLYYRICPPPLNSDCNGDVLVYRSVDHYFYVSGSYPADYVSLYRLSSHLLNKNTPLSQRHSSGGKVRLAGILVMARVGLLHNSSYFYVFTGF